MRTSGLFQPRPLKYFVQKAFRYVFAVYRDYFRFVSFLHYVVTALYSDYCPAVCFKELQQVLVSRIISSLRIIL